MPFTPPTGPPGGGYPYSDDSTPGANDGDVVYAEHVNSVMEYLADQLPIDILDAAGATASDLDPADLGTPDPGVSTELSRSDHVHQMPSAADVGAATEAYVDGAISDHVADTDPHGDRAYADALFAALDGTNYQGQIDASTNPNYPAADADDAYRISAAGKVGGGSGVDVEIGDLIICTTNGTPGGDQATVGAFWTIVQGNLNGVVIGPSSSTDNRIALFNGTSGRVIKQSTLTISDLATNAYTVADTNDWPGTDPTTVTGALDNLAARVTDNTADITTAQSDITTLDTRVDALETLTANTVTDDYTLVLSDAGKVVEMNAATAKTITVPPNASVAFPTGTIIELCQVGAGTTSIAPGSGVTIRSLGSATDLQTQWATASLRKRATNEWVLTGEII